MIEIIESDELFDKVNDYDVILVGTNTYYSLSHGFQRKVMINYPYVQEENMKTKYGDLSKMGTILECEKEGNPTFVLCYITEGYNFRPDKQSDYLSYESLEKCLKLVNVRYKGKKIGCTLLGTSRFDGNGDREKIVEIFNNTLTDVDATVYDYFQKTREEELREIREKELEVKAVDRKKYYAMVAERKAKWQKTRELNGHAGF